MFGNPFINIVFIISLLESTVEISATIYVLIFNQITTNE